MTTTPWPRSVRYAAGLWTLTAAVSATLLAALYFVFVAWGPGQRFDHSVYVAILDSGPVLGPVSGFVRPYGPQVLLVAAAVLTTVSLWRRQVRPVIASVLIVLISLVSTRAIRDALPRPDIGLGTFAVNGYPSGHVAVALALAIACVLLWPAPDRRLPAVVGGIVAGATALASVVVHAHLPVDVLGAPLVVTLVCCGVLWVVRPLEPTLSR